MFKAKLIVDKKYYTLRRKKLFLLILLYVPYFFNFFYNHHSIWLNILTFLPFVILSIWLIKTTKSSNWILGDKTLEIDENDLRIQSKNKKQLAVFKIDTAEKILVKKEYKMPLDNLHDVNQELKGNPQKNYLILRANNQDERFDFEVDSFYMINQLNKLIKSWSSKGIKVEEITE